MLRSEPVRGAFVRSFLFFPRIRWNLFLIPLWFFRWLVGFGGLWFGFFFFWWFLFFFFFFFFFFCEFRARQVHSYLSPPLALCQSANMKSFCTDLYSLWCFSRILTEVHIPSPSLAFFCAIKLLVAPSATTESHIACDGWFFFKSTLFAPG